MSAPTTNPELVPVTQVAQNKSMTYEEMRKIYPNLPGSLPRPTRTVECNMISYTDGEGAKKEIWIPKGTLRTACMHFENQDWDALTKFPAWNNQKYADEGEAEEKERKTWEWLVVDESEEPKEKAT